MFKVPFKGSCGVLIRLWRSGVNPNHESLQPMSDKNFQSAFWAYTTQKFNLLYPVRIFKVPFWASSIRKTKTFKRSRLFKAQMWLKPAGKWHIFVIQKSWRLADDETSVIKSNIHQKFHFCLIFKELASKYVLMPFFSFWDPSEDPNLIILYQYLTTMSACTYFFAVYHVGVCYYFQISNCDKGGKNLHWNKWKQQILWRKYYDFMTWNEGQLSYRHASFSPFALICLSLNSALMINLKITLMSWCWSQEKLLYPCPLLVDVKRMQPSDTVLHMVTPP